MRLYVIMRHNDFFTLLGWKSYLYPFFHNIKSQDTQKTIFKVYAWKFPDYLNLLKLNLTTIKSYHHNQDDKLHIYALIKSHLIVVDIFLNWINKFSDEISFEDLRPVWMNLAHSIRAQIFKVNFVTKFVRLIIQTNLCILDGRNC